MDALASDSGPFQNVIKEEAARARRGLAQTRRARIQHPRTRDARSQGARTRDAECKSCGEGSDLAQATWLAARSLSKFGHDT